MLWGIYIFYKHKQWVWVRERTGICAEGALPPSSKCVYESLEKSANEFAMFL